MPKPGEETITKITREKSKKGGIAFLAVVFKCLGILTLLGSLIAIILSMVVFFDTQASISLASTVQAFLSDAALGAALDGFVAGLIIFGIGELISLLNGIRRNHN
ncbi:MAG: hypothetical protein LBK67_06195 [Coriobacteriales bacterium]|nr:hypothetical protein [Coriobacteriales bacterium]